MSEISSTSLNTDLYSVQPVESQAPQKEEKQMQETTQKVRNTLYPIFNTITYPFQKILADVTYNPTTRKSILFNGLVSPEQRNASNNNFKTFQKNLEKLNIGSHTLRAL